MPRACAVQQEKPPQRAARALQKAQSKATEQQQRLCAANTLILLKENQYSDLQKISKLS